MLQLREYLAVLCADAPESRSDGSEPVKGNPKSGTYATGEAGCTRPRLEYPLTEPQPSL